MELSEVFGRHAASAALLRVRFVAPRLDFPRVCVSRIRHGDARVGERSHWGNVRIKGKVTRRINRRAVNTLIDVRQALRHAS